MAWAYEIHHFVWKNGNVWPNGVSSCLEVEENKSSGHIMQFTLTFEYNGITNHYHDFDSIHDRGNEDFFFSKDMNF